MAEVFLTKEAYKELEERLAYLKSDGRVNVAEKIRVARSFGDISENSEYDAAREEEALLEQEILQIEENLRNAKFITKSKSDSNKVNVGSTLEVHDLTWDEKMTIKIMGSIESDPTIGHISNESPMGKALIGRESGETVEFATPTGVQKYKILSINN